MSVSLQPTNELANRARHALIQELGVVDTMRFLNQVRTGSGDYTAEREQLFTGESAKGIAAGIKSQRNDKT